MLSLEALFRQPEDLRDLGLIFIVNLNHFDGLSGCMFIQRNHLRENIPNTVRGLAFGDH